MTLTGSAREAGDHWVVIVPQRELVRAKSRLDLPAQWRRAVVRAMVRDSVAAVLGAWQVRDVIVVLDRAVDARMVRASNVTYVVQRATDLNAALRAGAELGRARWPECSLAALPADLPGLRSSELDAALAAGRRHERTFVADRHGLGTTLLTARAGVDLDPRYGPSSRRAHLASGARENHDQHLTSLRHDVDDLADLQSLVGPGPHLQAIIRRWGESPACPVASRRQFSSSTSTI